MKVNNISGLNSYSMTAKNPKTDFKAKNSGLSNVVFQNASDTVSFTGLLPFQKVAPAIQKEISEIPVSKGLQKQLVKLIGQADTFLAKAKVLLSGYSQSADIKPDEKVVTNELASLADDIRKLIAGKNLDKESFINIMRKERDCYALMDKLNAEDGLEETHIDRVVSKKIMDILDELIDKTEGDEKISDACDMDLIKRLVGIVKDVKAADPEGVQEVVKEVSSVKLPFFKK